MEGNKTGKGGGKMGKGRTTEDTAQEERREGNEMSAWHLTFP